MCINLSNFSEIQDLDPKSDKPEKHEELKVKRKSEKNINKSNNAQADSELQKSITKHTLPKKLMSEDDPVIVKSKSNADKHQDPKGSLFR